MSGACLQRVQPAWRKHGLADAPPPSSYPRPPSCSCTCTLPREPQSNEHSLPQRQIDATTFRLCCIYVLGNLSERYDIAGTHTNRLLLLEQGDVANNAVRCWKSSIQEVAGRTERGASMQMRCHYDITELSRFAEVPLCTKPYCHTQVEALKVNVQKAMGTHITQ